MRNLSNYVAYLVIGYIIGLFVGVGVMKIQKNIEIHYGSECVCHNGEKK